MVNTPWHLNLTNSLVSLNHAGDAGGGIDTVGQGFTTIQNSIIKDNTCVNQGGGIWLDTINGVSSTFSAINVDVIDNKSLAGGNVGGGVGAAGNGPVTFQNCSVSNNSAGGTGGGYGEQNDLAPLTIIKSLFRDNFAFDNGGGIQQGGPSTVITSSEIDDNATNANGGGIFVSGHTIQITASTLADNTAGGNGGGIELETTKAGSFIDTSTIYNNSALDNNTGTTQGGGIDAPASFTGGISLLNDTINSNYANTGGGIFYADTKNSFFSLKNTILAGNFADAGFDGSGRFNDQGNNLIGIAGNGSGISGIFLSTKLDGTVASPLDALLGVFGNNGGPSVGSNDSFIVIQTEAPLTGSAAINNGNVNGTLATDERGITAIIGGKINIGAVA